MKTLYGSIEAGGTKFVCSVGTGPEDIRAETSFSTTAPDQTIGRAIDFFRQQEGGHGPIAALGVSSFGPIDPDPHSPRWGCITSTPKRGWQDIDFVGRLHDHFRIPIGWDTDVNGAALGEYHWGAARGLDTFLYMTIGTGIGGGGMARGKLLHGLVHPEMGHIPLPHDWQRDPYPGNCPYHGDCLEGMAAGPAVEDRWQVAAAELPPDHRAWQLEAEYLALALHTVVCVLSPQRIILGGGVMHQQQLFPLIRERLLDLLNGYVRHPAIVEGMDDYVVGPALGDRAGMLGGIALARQALEHGPAGSVAR